MESNTQASHNSLRQQTLIPVPPSEQPNNRINMAKRTSNDNPDHTPSAKRMKLDSPSVALLSLESMATIPVPALLCQMAAVGDIVGIKELLTLPNVNVNAPDYDGRTALHLATDEGHEELVKYLVSQGANVHATDRWGQTPLFCAFIHDRHTIAAYLQEHGARYRTLVDSANALPNSASNAVLRERLKWYFDQITQPPHNREQVTVEELKSKLRRFGLNPDKNKTLKREIEEISGGTDSVTFDAFAKLTMNPGPESIIERSLLNRLVIHDWEAFGAVLKDLFEKVSHNHDGNVATYIPELGNVDPNLFGVSVCTVDGQMWNFGDTEVMFPIQSSGKPILYSAAIEEYGDEYVHKFVGREPSGGSFNAFTLNADHKPHNACINAGAIVTSALYHPDCNPSQRFKLFASKLADMIGGEKPGFGQAVYLSEKDSAHTNFALAHFMAAKNSFPTTMSIEDALDFYFQMCSTELNCRQMAVLAATYAHNGVNPLSGVRLLKPDTVKKTVQMLFSCGMYDYSGEWACSTGLPAKSGVSGIIFVVVPGVCGFSIFAPPLDKYGNSVKGVEFAKALAAKYQFGMFDVVYRQSDYAAFTRNQATN